MESLSSHGLLPFTLDFSDTTKVARVVESSIPLLLQAQLKQLLSTNAQGQLVVLANSNQQAEYLYSMMQELVEQVKVYLCPDWGTLSYDQFNPSPYITSERISFLQALGSKQPGVYILSIQTALHRLAPVNYLVAKTNYFVEQHKECDEVIAELIAAGYRQVEVVYEPGEFALAGRNINFFPMGANLPFRIGFFEGQIDRIRQFDPENQQVVTDVEQIAINHGSEYPIDDTARQVFLENFVQYFQGRISLESNSIYDLMGNGVVAQGAQYYLPLFFRQSLSSLADYLNTQAEVVYFSGITQAVQYFSEDNQHRYKERVNNSAWPPLKVDDLYLEIHDLLSQLQQRAKLIEYEDYFVTLAKDAAAGVVIPNYEQATKSLGQVQASQNKSLLVPPIQPTLIDTNLNPQYLATQKDHTNSSVIAQLEQEFKQHDAAWQAMHTSAFLPLANLQQQAVQGNSTSTSGIQDGANEQRFNFSEKEKLVSLGLNRFNQPIIGDRTLDFLAKANQLTYKNLFAPQITPSHQLARLVDYLRKLKANFSKVQITLTVANPGRVQPFLDLIEDLPLEIVQQHEQLPPSLTIYAKAFTPLEMPLRGNRAFEQANAQGKLVKQQIKMQIAVSALRSGFAYYHEKAKTAYIVLSEQDVMGSFVTRSRTLARSKQRNATQVIQGLLELRPGQLLVHENHGICRYLGLSTMEYTSGFPEEMINLEFADTKLSVPVRDLHLLSVFSHQRVEDVERSQLSSVSGRGARKWLKRREEALAAIRDMASELLEVQSRRELETGFAFTLYEDDYNDFVSHFRYEETPDQYATIQQVLDDMCSEKKMDRLVCGDVGFGKTEIAMRAAYVAITNNKQVAILVPTTLLAKQHFESFRDRFTYTGANIELLSSFNSAQDNKRILDRLAQGLVDVVIGTHALLDKRVAFKDLGLLIIDEEHQFGVKQKEKIKSIKVNIDVLTMTATPIPRTLNLALNGFRDISLIATAPPNRLSIVTRIYNMDDDNIIRDAINREIQRGGQVFFIHNDIATQNAVATRLRELVPHARIAIGNGQMPKPELEAIMLGFHNQRYNILICSTIIETGIDVPNANTIIINNAQNFGMAQLHQLRGRVGRSFRQAYAYLLVPDKQHLNTESDLRLRSLIDIDSLGAGYILATHDLEIRGAGEILGENQSGKVDTIGYTLYMSMLQNAVKQLSQNKELTLENLTQKRLEIDLGIITIIPSNYIQAANLRVFYYRQIGSATSEFQLDEIANSMIENFGGLPPSVRVLFMLNKLRLRYQDAGLSSIIGNKKEITIKFASFDNIDTEATFALVEKYPRNFRLGSDFFTILNIPKDDIEQIRALVKVLGMIMTDKATNKAQNFIADASSSYNYREHGLRRVVAGRNQIGSQVQKAQMSPETLAALETEEQERETTRQARKELHENAEVLATIAQTLIPKRRGRKSKAQLQAEATAAALAAAQEVQEKAQETKSLEDASNSTSESATSVTPEITAEELTANDTPLSANELTNSESLTAVNPEEIAEFKLKEESELEAFKNRTRRGKANEQERAYRANLEHQVHNIQVDYLESRFAAELERREAEFEAQFATDITTRSAAQEVVGASQALAEQEPVKRKRGRPRKNPLTADDV